MPFLLCRNRVADFSRWRAVFISHESAHRRAGLHLLGIWPRTENRDDVFFMFRVDSFERARAFIADPGAAEAGAVAGVVDGEYHFLEDVGGYAPEAMEVS